MQSYTRAHIEVCMRVCKTMFVYVYVCAYMFMCAFASKAGNKNVRNATFNLKILTTIKAMRFCGSAGDGKRQTNGKCDKSDVETCSSEIAMQFESV